MNKQHPPVESSSDLTESLAENSFIQWVSQHGQKLGWILLGILALVLLAYRFLGSSSITGQDYLQAERYYQTFLNNTDPNTQRESFDQLAKLITKHRDLQSKYDGLIAQALLVRGDFVQALPYAERTLMRTRSDQLPFYADYARNTLLIADQKYPEALKNALDLKQKFSGNPEGYGNMLYAYNLLRIAMLQQALGAKEEEFKAWQEFKQTTIDPQTFDRMVQQLGDENVTLLDYIQAREKVIRP